MQPITWPYRGHDSAGHRHLASIRFAQTTRTYKQFGQGEPELNVNANQTRRYQVRLTLALVLLAATPAQACWEEAATRYQMNSCLLRAIAHTESGLNPLAVGRNRNGSRDIGLMQINSAWLPTLAAYGITEGHLFEPCTNIHVGAWILAGNIYRLGYTWEAVGAYNAAIPALRRTYINRVRRHLQADSTPSAPAARRATATLPR
jgi:soluble lytic murein transglycosylase-like protein